jgi:hypothetical protein
VVGDVFQTIVGCEEDGSSAETTDHFLGMLIVCSGNVVVASDSLCRRESEVEHKVAVECVEREQLATEAADDTRDERKAESLLLAKGYNGAKARDE